METGRRPLYLARSSFRSVLHIPLIIRDPEKRPMPDAAGKSVPSRNRIDIMPTIFVIWDRRLSTCRNAREPRCAALHRGSDAEPGASATHIELRLPRPRPNLGGSRRRLPRVEARRIASSPSSGMRAGNTCISRPCRRFGSILDFRSRGDCTILAGSKATPSIVHHLCPAPCCPGDEIS